ncbi:hypothetical protein DL93DRAFT_2087950 [Clavulina sp. PMI_390]|nr:hypothetical protein DL93DRAFT_2087950 [Clavulina sp. PMI_390]
MLIIVMGNSTSERRRREFRHQLLSSYRRYVGRRNTQGIPSPPPPPELFSERWLFPYEYINDLDQEPTCAAIACDTAWSEDMDMLRCVRCKKSYYCSKACQKRYVGST